MIVGSGILSYPWDIVRRRMKMQSGRKDFLYKNDCSLKMIKNEGMGVVLKGVLSNIFRWSYGALVNFVVYIQHKFLYEVIVIRISSSRTWSFRFSDVPTFLAGNTCTPFDSFFLVGRLELLVLEIQGKGILRGGGDFGTCNSKLLFLILLLFSIPNLSLWNFSDSHSICCL